MTIAPLEPVKFLLVDDLDENLLALEVLLERSDLVLLKARSGAEALELLLVHEVALALIDVQMPEMDGFELAELMRGSPRTRHVPIIFVTAGMRDQNRLFKGYDAGAVDFLFKPIDHYVLRNKSETFFRLHRQKQELSRQLELLRESEEFRRRMIESSEDCIAVLSCEGAVVSALSGQDKLFGKTVGGAFDELWEENALPLARAALERARSGELGRFVGESRGPLAPGMFWDVALTPIRDAENAVERLLLIARDVTERRKADRDRERLTNELENTLRFNETFMAVVGHDLRNPLNAVMMGAEVLLQRAEDPVLNKVARQIRSSGRRMLSMLDDLSDLARARLGGGIPVQREPADLLKLARKVVQEHSASTSEGRIELTCEGELNGEWDAGRVEQIISNLVGNALRHGRPDSPVRIHVDGRAPDSAVLSVHNMGHVPEDVRDTLFHPFRMGQRKRARSEGLGLGLFIVQELVKAHSGEVHFESSPEAGTVFRVRLPRAAEAARRLGTNG